MKRGELLRQLEQGSLRERLAPVYGSDTEQAIRRLQELMMEFADTFPCHDDTETFLFSTPGRTELGGNHTDHQHGCALAASVDLDTIACVVPNDSGIIRIKSRHHRIAVVELPDLSIHPEEADTSTALVRGVAAKLTQMGYSVSGFDAYTTTRVLRGSGLSSSAAFEVLVGTIMNHLFCRGVLTPTQIAQIGQYAENVYYGKPCGLLDQVACATGGVVFIDFADPATPLIRQVQVDLAREGYALCIIDSQASHADLTDDYAAIPREMRQIAACFGQSVLRDVPSEQFFRDMPRVREACGDRAVLRAMHFYRENERAMEQCSALEQGEFDRFLDLVKQSGRSSWTYLQNISNYRDSRSQSVALVLALAEE
ncbi:MAG: galactokinase, partial [Clostridium sp.]|nr:galactokinase [Clostridium sp.]